MSVFATAMEVLDETTAELAWEQFGRLQHEERNSRQETALAILHALEELDKLRRGFTPDYDYPWLAPMYALWYQSSHTQMAYHLAKSIPNESNPFLPEGPEPLLLVDFACGTMAMQFGAAIAAAELLESTGQLITVYARSSDNSGPMRSFGRELWQEFYRRAAEQSNNGAAAAIQNACYIDRFIFSKSIVAIPPKIRWLTILHAAYEAERDEIKEAVDRIVRNSTPDVIAVTAHRRSVELKQAFSPSEADYDDRSLAFSSEQWSLRHFASKVDKMRNRIFEEMIRDVSGISQNSKAWAQDYLVNDSLHRQRHLPRDTSRMLYVRKDG